MNKQDNPHAKGLSVNQDVICEDYYDPKPKSYDQRFHEGFVKTLLSEPTPSEKSQEEWQKAIDEGRVKLIRNPDLALDNVERELLNNWKQMRCTTVPKISIERAARFFPSLLKETLSFYFGQIPHLCAIIPIVECDRSGLSLTNPEE